MGFGFNDDLVDLDAVAGCLRRWHPDVFDSYCISAFLYAAVAVAALSL